MTNRHLPDIDIMQHVHNAYFSNGRQLTKFHILSFLDHGVSRTIHLLHVPFICTPGCVYFILLIYYYY